MYARDVDEIFNAEALEGINLSFPNPFRKLKRLFKKRNKGKEPVRSDTEDAAAARDEFRPLDISRQGWDEPLYPYPLREASNAGSLTPPPTLPTIVITACDRPDPGPSYPTTPGSGRSVVSYSPPISEEPSPVIHRPDSPPPSEEYSPIIHIPDSPPVLELSLPAPAFSQKDLVAIFGSMVHRR